MIKRSSALIFTIVWLCCFPNGSSPGIFDQAVPDVSKRVHVYCECHNSWINGRIENFAHVELRDGTSFGSVLFDATVEVNGHRLPFDNDSQTYKGSIGQVEQWQEIPILIQTQDKRKVRGHVVVVFMVRFTKPQPFATVPLSKMLPVAWEYSESSMHTVDLEIHTDEGEPVGLEVRGNHASLNLKRLGLKINRGERINLRVLPPWTSNYEFSGNLTRRSKAHFITSATLTLRFAD